MKVKDNIDTPPFLFDGPEQSGERAGIGRTDVSYGPYNDDLLKRMLPFRKKFVDMMGWKPEDTYGSLDLPFALNWLSLPGYEDARKDVDRYDCLEETLHFSLTDRETDEIIAGLRLTPVPSVRESLSWQMFETRQDMVEQANAHQSDGVATMERLDEIAADGNLWDLTRLVNQFDDKTDVAQVMGGMMELFGTAYAIIRRQSTPEQYDDIRWVFNGTEAIKFALEHLHVQFEVIADGKIGPEDTSKSYFCMVKCEAGANYIYKHAAEKGFRFPHRHLDDGLRKAHAL